MIWCVLAAVGRSYCKPNQIIAVQVSVDSLNDKLQEKEEELNTAVSILMILDFVIFKP